MQSDSRISDEPDYSVEFVNYVGMKTAGRNAGRWQATVLIDRYTERRTKKMIPVERAFGPKARPAAEKWREEYDGKIREGTAVRDQGVTLHERLDRYEAKRQRLFDRGEIAKSTLDVAKGGLRPIRLYFAKDFPILGVRKDTGEDFMEALLDGRLSTVDHVKKRGKLSGSQAAQSLRILKAVMEDALDNDLIPRNFIRNIEPPSTTPTRKLYLVRPEQVAAIVEAAEKQTPSWTAGLFATYGYSGARKMEGASLHWSDWQQGKLSIIEQLDDDRITRRELKTRASVRTIDFGSEHLQPLGLAADLEPWLGTAAQLRSRSRDFVFTTSRRTPVIWNIQRYLDDACQKAGTARLTPHMFRHSFATRLIYAGVPINEVTRILGHKNSQITFSTYVHCWDDQGHLSYAWPEAVTAV